MKANLTPALLFSLGLHNKNDRLPTAIQVGLEAEKEARFSNSQIVELRHLILALYSQVHGQGGLFIKEVFRKAGIRSKEDLKNRLSFISKSHANKSIVDSNGIDFYLQEQTNISRSNAVDAVYELADKIAKEEGKKNVESIHIALAACFLVEDVPPGNAELDVVRSLFENKDFEAGLATLSAKKVMSSRYQ